MLAGLSDDRVFPPQGYLRRARGSAAGVRAEERVDLLRKEIRAADTWAQGPAELRLCSAHACTEKGLPIHRYELQAVDTKVHCQSANPFDGGDEAGQGST